ncbi:MAG: galactose-1-phosphate uridylyltransferase [Nitrospirae bacterium]|nr:galactose-1-phosphate uridylyltransferase [Nitrospirota bacterium]
MPELRKDPITGRWVIISTERRKRASDFGEITMTAPSADSQGNCPFCVGHEHLTPPEILRLNGRDGAWRVRVVPNKFPALRVEGELDRRGLGVYDIMNGVGAHEVIIESPKHDEKLSTCTTALWRDNLWVFRERINDLKRDKRMRSMVVFKNYGEEAGATLEHPHSQLIALPIVPRELATEMDGAKFHFTYRERCIFCDILRQEMDQGERIVSVSQDFVAFEPFASRFPFETWIAPRHHAAYYEHITDAQLDDLSAIFCDIFRRLDRTLGHIPYNFYLHSAPSDGDRVEDSFHWHFEITPIQTRIAGFEKGAGFFINPAPPEEAATFLRGV